MLYREIIAVCSQIHTKHINTAVWAERIIVSVRPGGAYSDHWAYRELDSLFPAYQATSLALHLFCPWTKRKGSPLKCHVLIFYGYFYGFTFGHKITAVCSQNRPVDCSLILTGCIHFALHWLHFPVRFQLKTDRCILHGRSSASPYAHLSVRTAPAPPTLTITRSISLSDSQQKVARCFIHS